MNRLGLSRDHIIWIKTGLPQKEKTPHRANQIKIKCCIRQIRLGQVRALLFSFPPLPHPPASDSVKFTTAAAHASHNNMLYCCAELSSQAFVFFDPCERWGTQFFFCTGSRCRLLLDGPAPGWWPLRSSWCHPHRGRTWVRAFSLSFLFCLSNCLPAHSSVRVWPSISFLSLHRHCPGGVKPNDETGFQKMDEAIFGWKHGTSVNWSCIDDQAMHTWPPKCVWVGGACWLPREGWRSEADCPNAILASAFLKPGVVDGHHAPDLWKSAGDRPPCTRTKTQRLCWWMSRGDWKTNSERGEILNKGECVFM